MKKSIQIALLGLLLTSTSFIEAKDSSQQNESVSGKSQFKHLRSDFCRNSKKKKEVKSCLIGSLSTSSSNLQTLTTSASALSFEAYEFNTASSSILFSSSTPTQFTLIGPGVFLIEASGVLSTAATTSTTDNAAISLYNLSDNTAVLPAPLYNWEPGFAAPTGTKIGFGISRALQLAPGQAITYEIVGVASSSATFVVGNKILSVSQLQ